MPSDDGEPPKSADFGGNDPKALYASALKTGGHSGARGGAHWIPPKVEALQSVLPQYEILEILGVGGMGAVYKGIQRKLDRLVAIKVLPPGLDDEEVNYAGRFQQEAKAMARFKHPGIVSVYDAGETTDGLLYFVMELIQGTDVAKLVAAHGKLPPVQALHIVARVCEALAYAHERAVVHRDIKPSNVMIDADETVKIADFGLAKFITAAGGGGFTCDNFTMGTPDFLAPEARLPGVEVDQRADLYAVGVMLYEMLTGVIPRGRFDAPSGVVPKIDRRVDVIVDKAMQTDREKRYSTAIEMLRDVERAAGPSVALAMRVSAELKKRTPPAGVPSILRKTVVIALAAVAVIGMGTQLYLHHRSQTGALPAAIGAASPMASATATKEAPFVNSLGMEFVPVPIPGGPTNGQHVLFSVWETRVQDYEAFAKETQRLWPKTNFQQGPTHPAVMVSWEDAQAFCVWLTEHEHQAGHLSATERYRLPTDHEWSCAVGLGDRESAAQRPNEKDGKIADVFPWGTTWPPPAGTGNYAGEEFQPALDSGNYSYIKGLLTGYRDEFVETSPVGSFPPNRFGLYDLSGNAWEFCEDWFDAAETERVARGSSWLDRDRYRFLSSHRYHLPPDSHIHNFGFRCVLDSSAQAVSKALALPGSPSPTGATKGTPFVNSLGMKFVPVPITGGPTNGHRVLFSVWETRVQDYEVFAKETNCVWPQAEFVQGPTHPAVNVSWDDAQAFCTWLTDRERKAGKLGANERYRLPGDHEWSCAVGIGEREDPARSPGEKSEELLTLFPWGDTWPPPSGAGNYSGEEAVGHETWREQTIITGYRDAFPQTAPVGSFSANRFGLFDLGGNAWEWCDDQFSAGDPARVLRGASFNNGGRGGLYSAKRDHRPPATRSGNFGFRVVVAADSPK